MHQMFFNEDGWPVITPYRYTGETAEAYTEDAVPGTYKFINHGRDISAKMKESEEIRLESGGKITGAYEGTWELKGDHEVVIEIDGHTYKGVFLRQADEDGKKYVMTFTALCAETGTSIWGSALSAIE